MPSPTAKNFSSIVISYRREDSTPYARLLFQVLTGHFGAGQVFMDIDHIPLGEDFVQVIEDAVGKCEILIAIIGQNWHMSRDNPRDFVRLEIAAALERKILVIPVLVQGAKMPTEQELPENLASLARRNALFLSEVHWNQDMAHLITTLEKALAKQAAERDRQNEAEARQTKIAAHNLSARKAMTAKDWEGALNELKPLLALDPTYQGASEMLADAEKLFELSKLYNTGLELYKAERWSEALSSLKQVQSEVPDYEDVPWLIETAQRGLDKEEAVARRRKADEAARLKRAEQEAAQRAEDERLRLKREREHELEQAAIRREAERNAERDRIAAEARQREREQQELREKEEEEAKRVAERNRLKAEEESRSRAAAEEREREQKELKKKAAEEEAKRVAERNRLKGEEEARSRAAAEAVRREREQQELKKKGKQPTGIKATVLQQNREQVKRLVERNPLKAEGESLPRASAEVRPKLFATPSMVNTAVASGAFVNSANDKNKTKIKASWGCVVTMLIIGIAICGLAVYIFQISSFTSTLSAWLYGLAILAVGIVGLLTLLVAIPVFLESGKAPCPKCGEKLTGLDPGSNSEILCKKCHTYLEGSDHWLWQAEESRVSDNPVFSTQLTNDLTKKPIFPMRCCICGKPETRTEKVVYSSPDDQETAVQVPHCVDHKEGAALARYKDNDATYIKFRSLSYLKDYCKLNGTVPDRGY